MAWGGCLCLLPVLNSEHCLGVHHAGPLLKWCCLLCTQQVWVRSRACGPTLGILSLGLQGGTPLHSPAKSWGDNQGRKLWGGNRGTPTHEYLWAQVPSDHRTPSHKQLGEISFIRTRKAIQLSHLISLQK